ncbi:MAG: metallophosphoesterase [Firmicutes bacterium]|nr:metallophosphoesterase [Lachnospiraceae bacterium]MBQ7060133.1 metallophosphoesterase [Bacillota bacterium]
MKKKWIVLGVLLALLTAAAAVGISNLSREDYGSLSGWRRSAYAILFRDRIMAGEYKGSVSEEKWTPENEYSLEDTFILKKDPDKDFVILNFTDFHMGDYQYDMPFAIRTFEVLHYLVDKYQPDLVTLSGDQFWTSCPLYSLYWLRDEMDSLGIPWAFVLGNHDTDGNVDANFQADVMTAGGRCLFRKGDPEMGCGNYVINICEEKEGTLKPVHSLILMDTHGDGLYEKQIGWYRWAAEGISHVAGEAVKSTVIMHIPCIQFLTAYEEAWDEASGRWKEGYEAFGRRREAIAPPEDDDGNPVDNGLFAAVKEIDTTKNILCGHDHANDYSILYEGVRLTASSRVGIGGYYDVDCMGATMLTINSEGEVSVRHVHRFPTDE